MTQRKVRVRFAPSPTGLLHMGGLRTALFNYLFAKKENGDFILRIEDTDQTRFMEGAEKYIIDSLEWCGIKFNEGIKIGGPHAPYKQSERKDIYLKYTEQLIHSGHAYYAFDTAEELEKIRNEYEASKRNFTYDATVRNNLKNSFTLSEDEAIQRIDKGEQYVVRFKIPENRQIVFEDKIRGRVTVHSSTLDDKVLYKSSGMPTYHLANVVDDHLMEISHVIRGEEWLPSTPLHILLYEAFGWMDDMPIFAHLPLILKSDGKGKLSKRDGDRLGFPVFPLQWTNPETKEITSGYRESGYFPEAFINMIALLGWNPGTEQELFSEEELINSFSLERINKSGARFDPEKAKWFNHQYLLKKSDDELTDLYQKILIEKNIQVDISLIKKIVIMVRERANFVKDIWEQSSFFFISPETFDEKAIAKNWKQNTPELLAEVKNILSSIENFSAEPIHDKIKIFIENKGIGFGQVMIPLRIALVGAGKGPDLVQIIEMLGKNEVIKRIDFALGKIKI